MIAYYFFRHLYGYFTLLSPSLSIHLLLFSSLLFSHFPFHITFILLFVSLLLPHPQSSLFTFLGFEVTLGCILTSEVVELGTTDEMER